MCGIVGFIDEEENKSSIIRKMAKKIEHRGPDGEGYYIDEFIALGHKRLSIIDLDNGEQPMFNEDKNLVLVFNGEIYNYIELKEELRKKGHIFQNNTDSEVLLHGYEEWGKDLPKKLRGMFAFAIYNKIDKTLFCARDNFGIKPFYYYKSNDIFIFASEIKAILEHPKFKKELNKELIAPYLVFSFNPVNETFFKGVYCLEPGTTLTFKYNKINVEKYFDVNFSENKAGFNEIVKNITKVMENSINCHMKSDVEVGAFLSSGVDSSYLVSVAKPNKTYTVGYDIVKYNETAYAKYLTKKLNIENISKKITKEDYLNALPKALYYMDEPLFDPSAISLYLMSNIASVDVKVIISGEGADEFFAGYNSYKEIQEFKLYNKIPFFIRFFLAKICEHLPDIKGRNFIIRRGLKLEDTYVGVNKIFCEKELNKVLAFKNNSKIKNITKPTFDKNKKKTNLVKMQAIDIKHWLAKDILLKADKMSMANSIEVRTPFIDKEVFQIASSLKDKYKISKDNTKIALREVAKNIIPTKSYYKKKKLGFPVPVREWMKEDDLYNEIKQTISKEYVKEFFNQEYVLELLEQHKKGKKDNYKKVWSIYCFIKWYEIYFLEVANYISKY